MNISLSTRVVGVIAIAWIASAFVLAGVAHGAVVTRPVAVSTSIRYPHRLSRWRPPSGARLVRRVTRAHSTTGRVRAIDRLLRALGVGVYRGNGRMIVGGFERGTTGIYLYDFEVRLLADQLTAKRMGSFNQLAAQLRKAHEKLGGKRITGRRLAVAVAKGIKRLQGSGTPAGALAQVVYKLGLAHHVNLLHPPKPNRGVLDAVQRILIGIDATRSAGHLAGRPAIRTRRSATAARVVDATTAGDCTNGFKGTFTYVKKIGKMVRTKGKKGGWGVLFQEIKDGIDGVAMAYSVGVKAVKTRLSGKFGTNGPKSARPMRFQLKVIMRDDYNNGKPGCGRLAGYTMPRKGTIPGVPVLWERNAQSHLTYLGQTPSCGRVCITHTNSNGVATMTFRPDDEYLPGVGPKVYRSGSTTAGEFTQFHQHNVLGSIAQALGFNKAAVIRWTISYHHPAGYRIDLPAETFNMTDGSGGKTTWAPKNLEVCLAKSTKDIPHPLRPYWNGPLTLGGKVPKPGSGDAPLGHQGSWSGVPAKGQKHPSPYWGNLKWTTTAFGHTTKLNLTPFTIPIGFDTTKIYQDNGIRSRALWSFTGPVLHAHVTLFYRFTGGKSRTFDVPITQAKYCPSALG